MAPSESKGLTTEGVRGTSPSPETQEPVSHCPRSGEDGIPAPAEANRPSSTSVFSLGPQQMGCPPMQAKASLLSSVH